MSQRRQWFDRQMGRLFDARGLDYHPGQVAEYWRAIGGKQRADGRDEFTEPEIAEAFDRAIETVTPTFGIWSIELLVRFCRESRARQRPSPKLVPAEQVRRAPPPPEVLEGGREAVLAFYLGRRPKPEDPPPTPDRPRRAAPPSFASDETWDAMVGRTMRRYLRPASSQDPAQRTEGDC